METEKTEGTVSIFEIGKLYADRGDFFVAIEKLTGASVQYRQEKNFTDYLKSQNLLLRLYAETEQFEKIQTIKEELQDLVLKEGLELSSRIYYTLAICANFKGQSDVAAEYFQKSLALALSKNNKEDMCYAIYGMAGIFREQGKLQEALREIYNLQIFLEVLSIPEVKASTAILNGIILIELGKYEQAFDVLWQAYDIVRTHKTMAMHIYLLIHLGSAYWKAGQKELAKVYLKLAHKAVDPKNMISLAKLVEQKLADVGEESGEAYDLVFDVDNHAVVEKRLGKIDFKNQFILLDLLKVFVQNQGRVYSKEYLVENVWKQQYDPAVHDNKIYVTIKRLRKLIEPDYEKPKYIFRAKNGYYMNREAKVSMEDKGGVQ